MKSSLSKTYILLDENNSAINNNTDNNNDLENNTKSNKNIKSDIFLINNGNKNCPICSISLIGLDEISINHHIDDCLTIQMLNVENNITNNIIKGPMSICNQNFHENFFDMDTINNKSEIIIDEKEFVGNNDLFNNFYYFF